MFVQLFGTLLSGDTTWLMTLISYGGACGVDTMVASKFANTVSQVALDGDYEIHDFGIKDASVAVPESYTVRGDRHSPWIIVLAHHIGNVSRATKLFASVCIR